MRKKNRNLRSSGGDEGGITSGLSSRHPFSIPKRNGFVSVGESCILKTNHFKPSTYCDNIYRYELCKMYRESHLRGRRPAYDGRNRLYASGPFSFESETFVITLQNEEDSLDYGQTPQRPTTVFSVTITYNAFLTGAIDSEEFIQACNTVLCESPIEGHFRVGRSFYRSSAMFHELGGGLKGCCGFYRSIQRSQMGLSLNIDTSYKAFIKPQLVIDFVAELLCRRISDGPINYIERLKIAKALHGIKVYVTHRGDVRKKYRISGLSSEGASKLSFPVGDHGTQKTVMQYFQEKHGYDIQHFVLPCLQVGNQQRPNYLPMEVCKIAEGQHYREQLNEEQLSALREVTCQRPIEKELAILQTSKLYNADPYTKEFGITFYNKLTTVEGRVLPPPYLKFLDRTGKNDVLVLPKVGKWDMWCKKMVNGGVVNTWACINFAWEVTDAHALNFCDELVLMCNVSGMDFRPEPVLPVAAYDPKSVARSLKKHHKRVMNILGPRRQKLDLLILILPDNNGTLYGDIKRILETDIGVVSQCCLAKHVFMPKKQYFANVALKINVKVVASQDWPEITKYAGLVSPQTHREEVINNLFNEETGGMIKEHLISFRRATGCIPGRIIFYRDGVSNGQLNQVLDVELSAIKKACASLDPCYSPRVTFVVVQKRHHTRLFSDNYDVVSTIYGSGNVLPGTVIDKEVCHPTDFDFYLCSHAVTKGVSRPVRYHVLWDENKFTANALQTLTNHLCYTYARCTSSVSVVPPVYYAHLLASRGRLYIKRGHEGSFPVLSENVKGVMFFC
ncbi:unnamed protein product [Triticum turgidum subsp. durum]|uniref:Uncharacterized protein n=1 Tax=Triticum turgidum subsp. durum TaxID=4567 RepID=A0A9R1R7C1_TRITD|nr:unnamed protein product [Triticum turgidum subsp. durum]